MVERKTLTAMHKRNLVVLQLTFHHEQWRTEGNGITYLKCKGKTCQLKILYPL